MPPERTDCLTVLDFLKTRFPQVSCEIWRSRMNEGKVQWEDKTPIKEDDLYAPYKRVFYYREVEQEPEVPFRETILYQNDEILVACKPHFLPVTPTGIYVQQCLLNRLRYATGIEALTPMHRIDRETAGVVLFSVNPETRHLYHKLFLGHDRIRKTYLALAKTESNCRLQAGRSWSVANRMTVGEPWFRMKIEEGDINARSEIRCLDVREEMALFELNPLTGKTHQLRVHMSSLGLPLVNDRLYPDLQPKAPDNFQKPLQLLAHRLAFTDPVSGYNRVFETERKLLGFR